MKATARILLGLTVILGFVEVSRAEGLFYLSEQRSPLNCEWGFIDLASRKVNPWVKTETECPDLEAVFFDSEGKRSLYFLEDQLFEVPWGQTKGVPRPLGSKLKVPASYWDGKRFPSVWVSAESKRVRVGLLVPIRDEDIISSREKYQYRFAGSLYDAPRDPKGSSAMAMVYELKDDGSWQQLGIKATASRDESGLSVFPKPFTQPSATSLGGYSLKKLQLKAECLERPCKLEQLKMSSQVRENIYKTYKRPSSPHRARALYLPMSKSAGLLMGSMDDESGDPEGPVFLCEGECRKMTKVAGIADHASIRPTQVGEFVFLAVYEEEAKPTLLLTPSSPIPILQIRPVNYLLKGLPFVSAIEASK